MLRKKVDHSMNHKSLESRSINKKEISKKKRKKESPGGVLGFF